MCAVRYDAPGLGELLHARRQPDGVALRRVVHAEVVADLPIVPTITSPELRPMRAEKFSPRSRRSSSA